MFWLLFCILGVDISTKPHSKYGALICILRPLKSENTCQKVDVHVSYINNWKYHLNRRVADLKGHSKA